MEKNPQQEQAIRHTEGPLLVVAGAGTGKTSVIVRRIAHLIETKKAKPSEILALTFTDKAASEMEERVDLLVPYGFADVRISTFHAFGDRALREHCFEAGLSPDFQVLSQAEAVVLLREHLWDLPLDFFRPLSNPTRYLWAVVHLISRAKDELVSPQDYLEFAQKLALCAKGNPEIQAEARKHEELARLYEKYESLKDAGGFIDFGDQGVRLFGLFKNPAIVGKYQEQFGYILVDEFQDTNFAQFELVKMLAARHKNLTVVGDDDQSIYKFRGACLSNILGFLNVYPDAKKVVITQNYRSPQGILDASYRLIRHNDPERLEVKNKISKKLKSVGAAGGRPPQVHAFDKGGEEADFAAQRIWDAVQKGMKFSQFAILVRSNDDAEPFLQALAAKGVPYQFSGASGFAAHPEVKELVLFLRSIANPHEDISLFYTAAMPPWEISMSDLALFSEIAREKGISLFSFLKSNGNAEAKKFYDDMEKYLLASRHLSTGKLLYKFMEESGRVKKMGEQNEENIQRLARLFQAASRFSQIAPLDRVREFVRVEEEMLADISEDKMDFSLDAVSVLTVHKAKGLEFDVVFMVSLVEEKFPVRRHGEGVALPAELAREILPPGDTHMAEERRLFYVGMTRAKKELILTSAKDYGGKRLRKISRFIQEALDLPAARVKSESAKKESEILLFREEKPRLLILRGDLKLNASSIHEYLTCPLRYKYRNIIEWPVESHYTQVYGTALHKAIEVFHRAQLEGERLKREEIEEAFKKNWRGKGFLSREHEEKLYENGLKVLREYLTNLAPPKEELAAVEERFSFREGAVEIRGRWDRLDHRQKNWVIVDLKSTTRVETEEDAKEAVREPGTQRQAAIYILGFLRKKNFLPRGFEVLFLQSGQRAEIPASEKLLEKAVSSIGEAARGISAREFPARPSAYVCGHCPYRIVCPNSAV